MKHALALTAAVAAAIVVAQAMEGDAQTCQPGWHLNNEQVCVQDCPNGTTLNGFDECQPDDLQAFFDQVPVAAHNIGTPFPVRLPPGEYDVTQTIEISKPTLLLAQGAVLRGPSNVATLRVTETADYTRIVGLTLVGPKAEDDSGSMAIHASAHAFMMQNVTVDQYDTGVFIDGTGATGANSNGWRFDGGHVWRCRVGLHIDGADSNAFLVEGADFNANRRAVVDSSFLGGTYVGLTTHPQPQRLENPHVELDNANQSSILVGTYFEGNQAELYSESNRTVLAGGNGLSRATGKADRIGQRRGSMRFRTDGPSTEPYMVIDQPLSADIALRWIRYDGQGGQETWMIRRFASKWCITTGSSAGCVVDWPTQ